MKKLISKCDRLLLILVIIYSVFGLIMIFSASSVSTVLRYHFDSYHFFLRQLIFLLGAFLFGFVFILRFPTNKYKYLIKIALLGIIIALIGLFVYGKITNNAQSWYVLGPINLQPSEFAKIVLIVYMAVFYDKLTKRQVTNIAFYFIPLAVAGIITILVMMQPDLGSAVIILGLSLGIFISIPLIQKNVLTVLKIFLVGGIFFTLTVLYNSSNLLNNQQLSRLEFKNPCSRYTAKTGYQVCNSYIAIHNGGLFGLGLGNSTQKYLYLPESHTDFIFPIIVEELGLIVGIIVILGYVLILYRILKIAKEADNLRGSVLAYGIFLYLTCHLLINLMGILALIPLTGVPLPLLSYGGSFTMSAIIAFFIVERVAIENNINKVKKSLAKIAS